MSEPTITIESIRCELGMCEFEFQGMTDEGKLEIRRGNKIYSNGKQQLHVCKICGKRKTSSALGIKTSEEINRMIG